MNNKTIIISLGGSLIIPQNINTLFLQRFKKIIFDFTKKGNKVIIICGGGNIAREYQNSLKKLRIQASHNDLDWLGIEITKLNGRFIQEIFGDFAEKKLLFNPTIKKKTQKRIIVGCGWKPGWSTDTDAVLAAKTYHVKTIVNLSNISYVYNQDPRRYKNAKAYKRLTWKEYKKIVGKSWKPGSNSPFDPIAARLAEKLGMTVVILKGEDISNFKKFLYNKSFQGTLIQS